MNKRRVYSTHSREKVYHFPGCRYAARIPEKYVARQTKHSLDSAGYRPCQCCNVMKFRVGREFQVLNFYCKDKNMEFQLKSNILYVKTEIGCWKLVYRDDLQNFALYHRNDTGHPADFEHPEWETYHKQGDKPLVSSLIGAFTYIYQHDRFRKAEQETGGDIKKMGLNKKSREKVMKMKRRQKIRRVEYLFRQIESENQELIRLSIY